jgi:hypothetical protein
LLGLNLILAQYGFQGVDKVPASEDGGPCS